MADPFSERPAETAAHANGRPVPHSHVLHHSMGYDYRDGSNAESDGANGDCGHASPRA